MQIKLLGLQDYLITWQTMHEFTQQRIADRIARQDCNEADRFSRKFDERLTPKDEMQGKNERTAAVYSNIHEDCERIFNEADRFSRKPFEDEIWLVQHPPVFTQGYAGEAQHILDAGDISVVETDRGGQVTYHGPGQLVAYLLCDLKQQKIGIKQFVANIEKSVMDCLADYAISAHTRCDAPGVYVDGAKICSLGLRVKQGCTYHGLALNVAMDLAPYQRINPCGYRDMRMCQMQDWITDIDLLEVQERLATHLVANLFLKKSSLKS